MTHPHSRRSFLGACAAALAATMLPARDARAQRAAGPHPTPRQGITSAKVMAREKITKQETADLFDDIRAIPEVIDGIRCQCGCATSDKFYSLLSCYEGDSAMAKWCPVCQGEGRLAVRLHKEGKSLDDIRAAIDAKFG